MRAFIYEEGHHNPAKLIGITKEYKRIESFQRYAVPEAPGSYRFDIYFDFLNDKYGKPNAVRVASRRCTDANRHLFKGYNS